mmetsp:Transcript_4278/g.4957  ORF Transcript_4278/g.4957 Transcript_4278/m.4957 type:complete len:210 (-) Transcript_4278:696-1325(-)|eukprot:CAMPEP_0184074242 /NCGR_PEP_ID=MMETSP0957-20130417/67913_1 /TAXON_ID=627963 /ORGANISM="Aplanochytrium sp, Strain PBS07" /LENGTH=209 /DNA_ID=CAMNT_0026376287 /DNA_START=32 /DNA_END=661 /DNA_ORIENTATION=+
MASQEAELAKTKGIANVSLRRTWDKKEYRRKALERQEGPKTITREKDENGALVPVFLEKNKTAPKNLENGIGKSYAVNPDGDGAEKAGYYCETCDRSYMDSTSYLDHLNSRMHLSSLGMSMNVKKSTEADVKNRFRAHIQKKMDNVHEDEKRKNENVSLTEDEIKDRRKAAKKRKKLEIEKEKDEANKAFEDEEALQMMGFGSFGGKKK